MLNLSNHPVYFNQPKRLTLYSSWCGHIPFAMFIMELLKPKVFVELGTYYGDSYCAFCQAVKGLKLNTRCYAIDTWQGDIHMGSFTPQVLEDLQTHHDPLYRDFSMLIQKTFDEAALLFEDGTIDLLHIDGAHSYEAVKHDFETWLPKMSSQGVILFHDISVREKGFGVWRFWEELKSQYPSFDFFHSCGLGVLGVDSHQVPLAEELFNLPAGERQKVQNFFAELGYRLTQQVEQRKLLAEKERQLQATLNSYSWKITAPLRKLNQLLKSFKSIISF